LKKKISLKNVISAGFATSVEYFDFTLFVYVTVFMSSTFFPDSNETVATLKTFGLFAAGYFMRPIGGIFFGNLGDKYGRKIVLIITVGLMFISTTIIALTPAYNSIGISAVILILFARMIQGFSIGGEYNGVLAILSEQAPDERRGLVTAFGTFFSGFGVFFSTLVVFALTKFFTETQMHDYAWRFAFVIGMILSIIVLILQFLQDESPEYLKAKDDNVLESTPIISAFREYPYQIFIVFALAGYLGIVYYMGAAFLPTYLNTELHFSVEHAMFITMFSALVYAFTAPFWGYLSDLHGRKKILVSSCVLIGIIIYPVFYILEHTSSLIVDGAALTLLMIFISAATATFVVTINELFPTHLRFSGVATGYNISNALLGGTVPVLSVYLVNKFGTHFAPAYYAIIATIIIVIIIAKMPETRWIKLEE